MSKARRLKSQRRERDKQAVAVLTRPTPTVEPFVQTPAPKPSLDPWFDSRHPTTDPVAVQTQPLEVPVDEDDPDDTEVESWEPTPYARDHRMLPAMYRRQFPWAAVLGSSAVVLALGTVGTILLVMGSQP